METNDDPLLGTRTYPTDDRVWEEVERTEARYGEYSYDDTGVVDKHGQPIDLRDAALREAQSRGEREMLPGQKNFDPEAPYGRDAQGRPYSLPPGQKRTPEQQAKYDAEKRQRSAEIRKEKAWREQIEQERIDALRQKRMEELEAKKQRNLKEAEVARSWNNKVRAKRGLPPLGAPGAPGAPAGAPTQPGTPGMPPTPSRAPTAPTPPSPRGPIGAPSVSSVGQTPPMTPVRTLDGDFRRQVIGGRDNAVPLVELTNQGSFVPNPNALTFDEFASAYTVQDASSTADMIRLSSDPQAQREQQTIDQNRRSIMSSVRLDPAQKAQALQQLNSRQAQLHYGFLQAQGVGAGVRAGFGSISPNAPLMDQVYQRMGELEKAYPNSTAEQRYQLAMQMMSQAGSVGRADGSIPAEVRLMDELGRAEQAREQADIQKQQQEAMTRTVLDLQSKGMDPEDATAMANALASNDLAGAQTAMTKSSERKMLQAVIQAQAPISRTEIDKQIQTQVLGVDPVYSSKTQRYVLLAKAQGGDKKAQQDAMLYPDTEEWNKTFGEGGEFSKLNTELRKTLDSSLANESNRRKAEMQLREARGGPKLYSIQQPETQMAIISLAMGMQPGQSIATDKITSMFPDMSAVDRHAIEYIVQSARGGDQKTITAGAPDEVRSAIRRISEALRERFNRWGLTVDNLE